MGCLFSFCEPLVYEHRVESHSTLAKSNYRRKSRDKSQRALKNVSV